jgi:hypothetical protein
VGNNFTLSGPLLNGVTGGQVIEIQYNKGNATVTSVQYSIAGSSTIYTCASFTLIAGSVSHIGYIHCTTVGGFGRAHSFVINYQAASTNGTSRRVQPYDIFSYPPPVLVSNTIRLSSSDSSSGSSSLVMGTTATTPISFNVSYVQPSDPAIVVTYGPLSALTRYQCTLDVTDSTNSMIECLTDSDPSAGTNYFQIQQGGWISVGNDTLVYPGQSAPVVTAVMGCVNNAITNATSQCPTSGGVTIRVWYIISLSLTEPSSLFFSLYRHRVVLRCIASFIIGVNISLVRYVY